MTIEPRAALDRLNAALVAHFEAIATRRADDDPRVDDAYDVLADAFDAYDEALARVYSEVTPFELVDDHDDDSGRGADDDAGFDEALGDDDDDDDADDEADEPGGDDDDDDDIDDVDDDEANIVALDSYGTGYRQDLDFEDDIA